MGSLKVPKSALHLVETRTTFITFLSAIYSGFKTLHNDWTDKFKLDIASKLFSVLLTSSMPRKKFPIVLAYGKTGIAFKNLLTTRWTRAVFTLFSTSLTKWNDREYR